MNYLIIDWMNLVKRYTKGCGLEKLDEGEVTNTVTGYIINRLSNLLMEYKPDIVYICSDSGYNRRAVAINKQYKANRLRAKTLTEEEKEKNYIEFLKRMINTLPFIFLEVNDTEADMIIKILINFINKYDPKNNIIIASSDSDFIQLLDNNVSIFNWYKGKTTVNNWNDIHKLDSYLSSKNYALAKSIVGDKSDNIEGIPRIGWKKVNKLFTTISNTYGKDIIINNIDELEKYINNIDEKDNNLLKFQKILSDIENKKLINNNQLLIDLSNLTNPHIFKIITLIERETFKNKVILKRKEFLDILCPKIYKSNDDEYKMILRKNSKAITIFSYQTNKTKKAITNLYNNYCNINKRR